MHSALFLAQNPLLHFWGLRGSEQPMISGQFSCLSLQLPSLQNTWQGEDGVSVWPHFTGLTNADSSAFLIPNRHPSYVSTQVPFIHLIGEVIGQDWSISVPVKVMLYIDAAAVILFASHSIALETHIPSSIHLTGMPGGHVYWKYGDVLSSVQSSSEATHLCMS